MVRSRTFGRLAVTVLMISTVASYAQESKASWSFPDFTAVQLIGTKRRSLPMKVYWSGAGVRIETTPALADVFPAATDNLYRLTVYPDKTLQCIVIRTGQIKMMPSPLEFLQGIKVKRTAAGTETVEGHGCTVERVSVTRADGRTIESKGLGGGRLKGCPGKDRNAARRSKGHGHLSRYRARNVEQRDIHTSQQMHTVRKDGPDRGK